MCVSKLVLFRHIFFWGTLLLVTGCSPYAQLKAAPSASHSFEALPLEAILERHAGVLNGPDGGVMSFNPLAEDEPYQTDVRWTGKMRIIPEMRWDMVQIWGRFFRIPVDFTRQYTQEVQLTDQKTTLWIPATTDHIAVLQQKQTEKGYRVWLMLLGALKETDRFDYLFLINRIEAEDVAE